MIVPDIRPHFCVDRINRIQLPLLSLHNCQTSEVTKVSSSLHFSSNRGILKWCLYSILSISVLGCFVQPALADDEYYFVLIEGKALPLKNIMVNGTNVLGGSVVTLSLPINITSSVKTGLNKVSLECVTDPKIDLVARVEKRLEGPKKEEVGRVVVKAGEGSGKPIQREVSFNVANATNLKPIELTDGDKTNIEKLIESYYSALDKKNASELRRIYSGALRTGKRVFPESAVLFEKRLDKEVRLLKNPSLKMKPYLKAELNFKVDGDRVWLTRKDGQPLMESNEIETTSDSFFSESDSKVKVKERLVTSRLCVRKIGDAWQADIPSGM